MAVVILQGPSGSGKTTLAARLSNDTGIPYIGKDTIKEMLFDSIGAPNGRAENRAYGHAANAMLFTLMSECVTVGKPLILDCFFDKEAATSMQRYAIDATKVLQLYVTASPEVLLERFNNRVGSAMRHRGHNDTPIGDVATYAGYAARYRPLAIANTIQIDTTGFNDREYAVVQRQVDEFLGRGV